MMIPRFRLADPARALRTLAALLASSPAAPAQDQVSPSFDCAKETGAVERAICGDPKLAELDQYIAQYFKVALEGLGAADAAALRTDQRAWLATRAGKRAHAHTYTHAFANPFKN